MVKYGLATPAELLGTDCEYCLNKEESKQDPSKYQCLCLTRMYWQDGDEICLSLCDDPVILLERLKQMRDHLLCKGANVDKRLQELNKDIARMSKIVDTTTNSDIRKVYIGEVTIVRAKGGGEKADKTNKMFGEQRMKDNRYKEPWGYQDKHKKV